MSVYIAARQKKKKTRKKDNNTRAERAYLWMCIKISRLLLHSRARFCKLITRAERSSLSECCVNRVPPTITSVTPYISDVCPLSIKGYALNLIFALSRGMFYSGYFVVIHFSINNASRSSTVQRLTHRNHPVTGAQPLRLHSQCIIDRPFTTRPRSMFPTRRLTNYYR